jgi:hypothetical protein
MPGQPRRRSVPTRCSPVNTAPRSEIASGLAIVRRSSLSAGAMSAEVRRRSATRRGGLDPRGRTCRRTLSDLESWRKGFEPAPRRAARARDEEAIAPFQHRRLRALVVPTLGMPIVSAVRIGRLLPRHRSIVPGRAACGESRQQCGAPPGH